MSIEHDYQSVRAIGMSEPKKKVELSPVGEGLIGAVAGTVVGVILWRIGVISAPAIPGVMLGLGIGSWFNAWRRAKNAAKD